MRNLFIAGERIYLRAVEESDAGVVAACNNDPEVRASFFTHSPTSAAVQAALISGYYQRGADYIPFAICLREGGKCIGITALHRVDLVSRAAVYSICIGDSGERGKGLARDVTQTMLRYAFDVLNLHRVQLHVWAENDRAISVYQKCGFVREGVLREAMKHEGVYCDFLVMGVLEEEWRATRESV